MKKSRNITITLFTLSTLLLLVLGILGNDIMYTAYFSFHFLIIINALYLITFNKYDFKIIFKKKSTVFLYICLGLLIISDLLLYLQFFSKFSEVFIYALIGISVLIAFSLIILCKSSEDKVANNIHTSYLNTLDPDVLLQAKEIEDLVKKNIGL